jgi:hypothetical protein
MKQQTAVQWLVKELLKHDKSFLEFYAAEISQAKEMEKEQIETAYLKGQDNIDNEGWYINENGQELYYNTTFKNK